MTLSQENFDYVRAVVRERSAHVLEDDKRYLVETRLLPVARRHGCKSIDELVTRLRQRRNEKLLTEVVEAMAINETAFFRDGHPFDALRQIVIPELMKRRSALRMLNTWSAACASGQEAYSVAILLRHHFPELAGWNVRIIASDLSVAMVERARQGLFSPFEVSRGLEPELLERYFLKEENGWRIRDDLRRLVDFRAINLSGAWPALPPLDLVLLRNVLIYFDLPTRRQILDKVRGVLEPDGYLLLGGAETTFNLAEGFTPVASGIYQRRAGAA